jgi:hypothetical protein
LADRPDLQRQYLGGPVPVAPPIGTFKPGGEDGVKQFIDQDRAANGIAPRYAIPAVSRGGAEDVTLQRMSARGLPALETHNLLQLTQEMQGLPEDEALRQQAAHDAERARQAAQFDQRPVPESWPQGIPPTAEDHALRLQGPPPETPATDSPLLDAYAPANYEGDPREAGVDELHGTLHTLRERLEDASRRVEESTKTVDDRLRTRNVDDAEMRARYIEHIKEQASWGAVRGAIAGSILGDGALAVAGGAAMGTVTGGAIGAATGASEGRRQYKDDIRAIHELVNASRDRAAVQNRISELEEELRRRGQIAGP